MVVLTSYAHHFHTTGTKSYKTNEVHKATTCNNVAHARTHTQMHAHAHTALTFIPRVEHTSSQIALSWLLWKWIAISNSISPNDAVTPLALKTEYTRISYSTWGINDNRYKFCAETYRFQSNMKNALAICNHFKLHTTMLVSKGTCIQ